MRLDDLFDLDRPLLRFDRQKASTEARASNGGNADLVGRKVFQAFSLRLRPVNPLEGGFLSSLRFD